MEWRPLRIDYFSSPPEALRVTHYASGASRTGDLRGFARVLYPIGVSAPELAPAMLGELVALAHLPLQVFVDNGAFSEVEIVPDGPPRVVRPISVEEWARRLRIAHVVAAAFGSRATIVAPDQVGSQSETLIRLARHADAVRGLRAAGARIVVPIQCGAMPAELFDVAAARAVGFSDFARGIPGNKAAMTSDEVERLVAFSDASDVHLLGVGYQNPRFRELVHAVWSASPKASISCDSNLIAAHAGKTNGKGGAPRALTDAEETEVQVSGERSRENAIVMAFGPAVVWRRVVQADLLGPSSFYRGTSIVQRINGDPAVLMGFGEPPPRPARQLDLFGAKVRKL